MEILSPMTEAVKVEYWKQCVKAGRHIQTTSEFAQVKWSGEFRLIWCRRLLLDKLVAKIFQIKDESRVVESLPSSYLKAII